MKRVVLKIVILIMVTTMLVGCTKGSIINIGFEELNNKLENKDSFILVVAQEGCPHCQKYEETLNELISKYKIDIYVIDIAKFTESQKNIFTSSFTFADGLSTPTTIFVENGKETTTYDRIVGSSSLSNVVKSLEKKGYIR